MKNPAKLKVLVVALGVLLFAAAYLFWFSPLINHQQSGAALRDPEIQKSLKAYGLKGRVKSVREENYKQEIPAAGLDAELSRRQQLFFNEQGYLVKSVSFVYNTFEGAFQYVYDDDRNIIVRSAYDRNEKFLNKETFEFDLKGRVQRYTREATALQSRWINTYTDRPGGYSRKSKSEYPATRPDYAVFDYDSVKHQAKSESHFGGNRFTELYTYDKKGNVTGRTEYDSADVIRFEFRASYNTNGLPVQKVETRYENGVKTVSEMYYAYDEKGNVIEYTRIANGELDSWSSYRVTYTYDVVGNWTHRAILKLDGTPQASIDRVIAYY